ncbi:hypothetical protein CGRA01v4_13246 [Colletotrichum graminicola]|nr:hypothetical protein CGRA01v4_13246 [Colletotrichum graminicola]
MGRSGTTRSPLLSRPVHIAAPRVWEVLGTIALCCRGNSILQLCSQLHVGLGQCGRLAHLGSSVPATSSQYWTCGDLASSD